MGGEEEVVTNTLSNAGSSAQSPVCAIDVSALVGCVMRVRQSGSIGVSVLGVLCNAVAVSGGGVGIVE